MAINGIPVKLRVEDKDGNLTQLETIYFATFRKCPALAGIAKSIMKLDTQIAKQRRLVEIAADDLAVASREKIDAAAEKLDAANLELHKVDDKHTGEFNKFFETGLKAAGYNEKDIERFRDYVDFRQMAELLEISRLGAGRCDFFTEETPVPPS